MDVSLVPALRPSTPTDLQRARERVSWVDDDDLREVERKSPAGAAALSFLTWGGGHLYLGDLWRGGGLIAALFGWASLDGILPDAISSAIFVAVGVLSAVWSHRKARDVNRFVSIRNELTLRQSADPAAYRLLSAAATVNPELGRALPQPAAGAQPAPEPGKHAELLVRLRKLVALHQAGVINDAELRERKIDLMTEIAPANQADLDELLYDLLPLVEEGTLEREDIELLKQLGGTE